MDIPVNAVVYCADGICGRSAYAVLNPVTDQVTHMVVEEKRLPHTQRIVPIDDVMETAHDRIRLRCTGDELAHMQVFSETKFVDLELPEYEGPRFQMWPTLIPKTMRVLAEHRHIPKSELAVRRGAHVEATDGYVGRLEEFVVDPTNQHITDLVIREGHLWGQKEVIIPVSQIDRIEEDVIRLKMDKHSVEELPAALSA